MDPSNNNSFGSFGSGANARPIVSSGSGDVVLPMSRNNNGKKRKRGLIIVGIIFVLVAVGLGATALIMNMPRNESTVTETGNYVDDFNIFANYVVNGEKRTEKLGGEYNESASYAINKIVYGEDEEIKKEYILEMRKLWNDFYEDYEKSNYYADNDLTINVYIKKINATTEFLEKYESVERSERAEVIRDYLGLNENQALTIRDEIDALNRSYLDLPRYVFYVEGAIESPDTTLIERTDYDQ